MAGSPQTEAMSVMAVMPDEVSENDHSAQTLESPLKKSELVRRAVSGLVLAPLGLWVVLSGGAVLAVATAVCACLAAFEWVGMSAKNAHPVQRLILFLVMASGALGAVVAGRMGLEWVLAASILSCLLVGVVSATMRRFVWSLLFGSIYVSFPFGAFVWLGDVVHGGNVLLLLVLVLVWTTDISAFLAGRGFGGPPLAPRGSPNKTWTGALGALICTAIAGAAIARFFQGQSGLWMMFAALVSIVAQAGDLMESRFKRLFGVKDTSRIIPGHGGVLDRLDSLMAVTAVMACVIAIAPDFATELTGART